MKPKNTAAREVAQSKKNTGSVNGFTANVCISTAHEIAHIAERFRIPPALVAGTLAELGLEMLQSDGPAEAAGLRDSAAFLWLLRRQGPPASTEIPILTSQYTFDSLKEWEKGMGRESEELLGQMIELALPYYHKKDVILALMPSIEHGAFHYMASNIREDNDGNPEAMELMKDAPKPPKAFLKFEQILAATGGAE